MNGIKQAARVIWRPLKIKAGVLEHAAQQTPLSQLENSLKTNEELYSSLCKTFANQRYIIKKEQASLYQQRIEQLEDEMEIILQTIIKKKRQRLKNIKKWEINLRI